MSKRSAQFVAALTVSVLAGANLATVTDLRAQAATADDCLTAPKGATTPGSHWYYRIDRATKRQCWYLREESDRAADKSTRATPPASSAAAAEPAAQPPRTMTPKAVSDARAEWFSQQSRAEQAAPANPGPQTIGAAPSMPAVQEGKRGIGTNVLAPAPVATSRWLDNNQSANAASNPANVQTIAAVTEPAADQQQDAEPAQQPTLQSTLQPQPATGITSAAADPSTTKPTASLQMLLAVMAAALALAGIIVSLLFRLGRVRARRAMRRQRLARWDAVKSKGKRSAPPTRSAPPKRTAPPTRAAAPARAAPQTRAAPQVRPAPQMRPVQPTFQREREEALMGRPETMYAPRQQDTRPRQQDTRERQVNDMLARLARSAQR